MLIIGAFRFEPLYLAMTSIQSPNKRGRQASFHSTTSTAFSTPKGPSKPLQSSHEVQHSSPTVFDTSQGTVAASSERSARVGVIVSVTSSYYLVRSGKDWLPVRFADLFDEKGQAVPRNTPFASLKHRSVQLKGREVTYRAYLAGGKEEGEGQQRKRTLSLARKLCEDVTAMVLAAKASNNRSSSVPLLLSAASTRLRSALPGLLTSPALSPSLTSKLRLHLLNLSSSPLPLCPSCHHPQFHLLSCGHSYCLPCVRQAPTACQHCTHPLSKADFQLAASWKP